MTLENISLSQVVRYGLTGLIAVILFLIIPLVIFNPGILRDIENMASLTAIAVLGVIIGFLLDAMKIYQFSYGYRKGKERFLAEISDVLEVSTSDASSYFSKAFQLDLKNGGGISFSHSRWVLMNIASKLFIASGFLWLIIISIGYYEEKTISTVHFLILVFSFLIGYRLTVTTRQEEAATNKQYIVFCRENKGLLKLPMNISTR